MRPRDLAELVLLGALWGGSFLFMRVGAAEFGAVPLAWVRVALAAAALLLVLRTQAAGMAGLRAHWRPIAIVGLFNSALPFALFAYALLTISGSLGAVFNAAAPLFGAVIAWAWLGQRLDGMKSLGLLVGFAGVFGLAWAKAGPAAGGDGMRQLLAVGAALLAAASYGWSAAYTRKHAHGVPPLALATGSQVSATLALAVPALFLWPSHPPGMGAWTGAVALAVLCTALAYILYFRLIAHAGPANALTVTYLVPVFAVVWGALFLDEWPTTAMLVGCAVILSGTALANRKSA